MAKLPDNAHKDFLRLAEFVRDALVPCEWPFEAIKGPVLGTWANESGWGHSVLALEHNNFAGMKWNKVMEGMGDAKVWPVDYQAWDGRGEYCHFKDNAAFVEGYFYRLDHHPAYKGWREAAKAGGQRWIEQVAPVWFGMNPKANRQYVNKIRSLWEARIREYLLTSPKYMR